MSTVVGLLTFANFSQYTGLEQTRISGMLYILAIVSIVMWIAVCLSMVARVSAKLWIKRIQKNKVSKKDAQVE